MENAMRLMIDDANIRRKFQAANREFVKQFDWDKEITPQWLQLIEQTVGEEKSQQSTLKQTASEQAVQASNTIKS
jgi:hypothetical protein